MPFVKWLLGGFHFSRGFLIMKNLNDRLDLDNYITDVVKNYPKNEDDYLFYIRGKNSTNELIFCSSGNAENFGLSLFNIATQNKVIMNELEILFEAINKYKKETK